jgi:hypothetical protein
VHLGYDGIPATEGYEADLSMLVAEGRALLPRLPRGAAAAVLAALAEPGGAASDAVVGRLRAGGLVEELEGPGAGLWDEVEALVREGRRLLGRLPEGASAGLVGALEVQRGAVADAVLRGCGAAGPADAVAAAAAAAVLEAVSYAADASGGGLAGGPGEAYGAAEASGSAIAGGGGGGAAGGGGDGSGGSKGAVVDGGASLFERLVLQNLQPGPRPEADQAAQAVEEAAVAVAVGVVVAGAAVACAAAGALAAPAFLAEAEAAAAAAGAGSVAGVEEEVVSREEEEAAVLSPTGSDGEGGIYCDEFDDEDGELEAAEAAAEAAVAAAEAARLARAGHGLEYGRWAGGEGT